MNNVTLIGRVANDLEIKSTANGTPVCQFNLAVNRFGEGADFIPVVVYKKQAENLVKYQSKGSQIGIVGRIQVRPYEKNGEKRTWTEVVAHEVEFLGSKQQEKRVAEVMYERKSLEVDQLFANDNKFGITDEDLPF